MRIRLGTHISNTREAKAFALLSEEGIANGVRRITAVTTDCAFEAMKLASLLEQEVTEASTMEESSLEKVVFALSLASYVLYSCHSRCLTLILVSNLYVYLYLCLFYLCHFWSLTLIHVSFSFSNVISVSFIFVPLNFVIPVTESLS